MSHLPALATMLPVLLCVPFQPAASQEPAKPAAESVRPATAPTESPKPAPDVDKTAPAAKGTELEAADVSLQGYCPVSYHTDNRAIKGDGKYRVEHLGLVYHLADADKQKKFQEDPQKYIPRIGGLCTVALGGPYGNRFRGDPQVFAVVEGKLYLCSSERAKRSFDQRPEHYIGRAEELYKTPELMGMCPVSLHRGEPSNGKETFRYDYRGVVYHLKGAEELDAFKKDPDRYAPQYGAFCAEGVAAGELRKSDPLSAIAHNGRTYLFADVEARARCMASEKTCIPQADDKWKELKGTIGKAPGGR